jgi:hypothetical protein
MKGTSRESAIVVDVRTFIYSTLLLNQFFP